MILERRGITLTRNVLNAINTARKAFEIESFPGDFFERLMMAIILINTNCFCLKKILINFLVLLDMV